MVSATLWRWFCEHCNTLNVIGTVRAIDSPSPVLGCRKCMQNTDINHKSVETRFLRDFNDTSEYKAFYNEIKPIPDTESD